MTPKFEKTRSIAAELAGIDTSWQAILHNPVLIAPHLSTHNHQTVLWILESCNIARGIGELSDMKLSKSGTRSGFLSSNNSCATLMWFTLQFLAPVDGME